MTISLRPAHLRLVRGSDDELRENAADLGLLEKYLKAHRRRGTAPDPAGAAVIGVRFTAGKP